MPNPFPAQRGVRPALLLTVGHATVDLYENLLPPLLPFLALAMGLSHTLAGLLVTVYSLFAFMMQPVFGLWVDRRGRGWLLGASLLWAAVPLAMSGLAPSYTWLLVLAILSGLGNALHHPLAAITVSRSSGSSGTAVGLWSTSGNIGTAAAPLAVTLVVGTWGLSATPGLVLPALAVGLLLLHAFSRPGAFPGPRADDAPAKSGEGSLPAPGSQPARSDSGAAEREGWRAVGLLCLSVMLRGWAVNGIKTFLPLLYLERGEGTTYGGYVLTAALAAVVVAIMIGGYLSDRVGVRKVSVYPLFAAGPVLVGATLTGGLGSAALFALGTSLLMMPHSVNLVHGQRLLPRRAATVSGLVLGFPMGVASIAVTLTGALADAWHMQGALMVTLSIMPLASALIASLVPERVHGEAARPSVQAAPHKPALP